MARTKAQPSKLSGSTSTKRILWRSRIGLAEKNGERINCGTQTQNASPDFAPLTQYLAEELNATYRALSVEETKVACVEESLAAEEQDNQRLRDRLEDQEEILEEYGRQTMFLLSQLHAARNLLNQWDAHALRLERQLYAFHRGEEIPRPTVPIAWSRPSVQRRADFNHVFRPMEPEVISEEDEDDETTDDEM